LRRKKGAPRRSRPDFPCPIALFELEGTGVELIVRAVLGDKLLVRTTFDDVTVVEDDYHIGVAHGGEPVRDHERGAALHEGVHAVLDDLLGAGVDG